MFYSIVLIRRVTTKMAGRNVSTITTVEMLTSRCLCRRVNVSLHQKDDSSAVSSFDVVLHVIPLQCTVNSIIM